MRALIVTVVVVTLLPLLVACGESEEPSEAEETFSAEIDRAKSADFDKPTRNYARKLCDPYKGLLESFVEKADLFAGVNNDGGDDADLGDALVLISALREPINDFADDLEDVDSPKELREYHREFLGGMLWLAEATNLVAEEGLFSILALGDAPETPPDPPGLEDAILAECGEDIAELFENQDLIDLLKEDE